MDSDLLFIVVVIAVIVTVFVLGVATGCGYTYWQQWTISYALQVRYTHTTQGVTPEIKGKLFGHPAVPGKLFHTKEQLKKAVEAARKASVRPDTSRVIRRSL